MSEPLQGSCLCGAVAFQATPIRTSYGACHCDMCRQWTAGPFLAAECGDSFEVTKGAEDLAFYASSKWGERGFCRQCGSSLVWRLRHDPNHHVVSIAALKGAEALHFASEIFIDEKPESYTFANDTKTMTGAEVFALFAGEGDNHG